ncbi:MAG: transposase, partial [Halobacteriales archaeon]
MEVRRTAPVKLVVPDEYHEDLHETADQFLYCANQASDYCWDNTSYKNCITSNSKARDVLYDRLKDKTDLNANLVQEAIRRAVHAVDSGVDRWKTGKRTNKPEFTSWSIVFDK